MALSPVPIPGPQPVRPTDDRVRKARLIAVVVDLFQIVAAPVFGPGVVSPANDLLDVATAIVLTRLLGWHFGFLPSFIAELVPGMNLIPTWTAAVFIATRTRSLK